MINSHQNEIGTQTGDKINDNTNMATGNNNFDLVIYWGDIDGVLGRVRNQAIKTHAPSHA